jgi:TonB-linked SusC/RagA family outer membrane protein
MGKYLVTLTGRFDGSSRLAEGNKWGFFPSVGLGWILSEESFMQNQDLFTELKLRGSWGQVGNTGISPYTTAGNLASEDYAFGSTPGPGYRPSGIANPDLKWEVSSTVNIGLDFGLFNDRVVGSFEVYQTNTTDLLLSRNLPPTSGFSSVLENIGETQNTGWEITLNTRNIQTPDITWTTEFNLFGNKEKIVDLYGDKQDDVGNRWFIDEPLTVYYDYDKVGIWQLGEEADAATYGQIPGDIHVRDVNNDGLINQEDRVILGSNIPDMTLGFTSRLRYKMFDFSVFMFGSFGQMIYNDFRVGNSSLQTRYNNLNVDYWTPTNPTNMDPRPNNQVEYPQYRQSRGYEDGSFLKIRNMQLGYTLPSSLLNQYGIQYMRFYLNANTPWVTSGLSTKGVDPEIYSGTVSSGALPSTKLWSFGVDVTF